MQLLALTDGKRKKVTINTLKRLYAKGQKIVTLTAYDYPTAMNAESGEADVILVGDSLAMVALGYNNTNQITMQVCRCHLLEC
jgi:3-methyl-2-oxobutanoate hydroxymethyltransferase